MHDDPTPLPARPPLSERDRLLRSTLTELSVHTRCGRIRGPVRHPVTRADGQRDDRAWQSCACEDEPARWAGCDVSEKHALCVVCARGIAGGSSRWSWIGCANCREINSLLRQHVRLSLPLGRHSIMNGVAIRGDATPQVQQRATDAFMGLLDQWRQLDAWRAAEVRRLVEFASFPVDADVPLRTWRTRLPASSEASIDAISRLLDIDVRHRLGTLLEPPKLSYPHGILGVEVSE